MADDLNPEGGEVEFSLAMLAGIDATEIAMVKSESLPQLVGDFEGVSAKFEEFEVDGEKRFGLQLVAKVNNVVTGLTRGIDKETLLDKTHRERLTVRPTEALNDIGRIRQYFDDLGLPSAGAIGGANDENGDPVIGFVDGFEGHVFRAKITHRPNKNDSSRPYANLRPDDKYNKKAAAAG